jgi:hypothetical protein
LSCNPLQALQALLQKGGCTCLGFAWRSACQSKGASPPFSATLALRLVEPHDCSNGCEEGSPLKAVELAYPICHGTDTVAED